MPKVNCPGCKSLITIDPEERTSIVCPACGKQLRVKMPAKAAPVFAPKPKPVAVPVVRRPVEDDDDEVDRELVRRKKKKKKPRGPSGRVSGLLMPLGGLATLLLIGLAIAYLHAIAAEQKAPVTGVAYVILFVVLGISLAIGAAVMQYSVNSLSRRNRVPSIDFVEAAVLSPLVSIAGILGAMVILIPLIFIVASGDKVPGRDDFLGAKVALFLVCFLFGGVAAMVATIKYTLNTRWNDAGSISARFIVVSILSNIAINMVIAAVVAVVRTDVR